MPYKRASNTIKKELLCLMIVALGFYFSASSMSFFFGKSDPSSRALVNPPSRDDLLKLHQLGDVQAELDKILSSKDSPLISDTLAWLKGQAGLCWPVCVYMLARYDKDQFLRTPPSMKYRVRLENRERAQKSITQLLMLAYLADALIPISVRFDPCFPKIKWEIWWYWQGEQLFHEEDEFQSIITQVAQDLKREKEFIANNISPWWVVHFEGVSALSSTANFLNFDKEKGIKFAVIADDYIDYVAARITGSYDNWNEFFHDVKEQPPLKEWAKSAASSAAHRFVRWTGLS